MRRLLLEKRWSQRRQRSNCDIAASDLGDSEGAAATEQAERTVGHGGGKVTPTEVPDHEDVLEKGKGSEAGSEDDTDFDEE